MREIRITSVSKPFDDPELEREAVRAITRADAMGLLAESEALVTLDLPAMRHIAAEMSAAGIAGGLAAQLGATKATDARRLAEILRGVNDALDASPLPQHEWTKLRERFDTQGLAQLVHVSPASVRRYAARERPTPDSVAARVHFLALVVGDLAGAYNDIGIRRWFGRKRAALGGRAPAELLAPGWSPDHQGPRKVRDLAGSLLTSPAT